MIRIKDAKVGFSVYIATYNRCTVNGGQLVFNLYRGKSWFQAILFPYIMNECPIGIRFFGKQVFISYKILHAFCLNVKIKLRCWKNNVL